MIRPAPSLPVLALLVLAVAAGPAVARPKQKPAAADGSILVPAGPPAKAAPPPAPPAPKLADIATASEEQVRLKLGAPDVARREGAGAFWTYQLKSCALFVYFRLEDGHGLRVSGAAAGPRHRGQSTPSVDACLNQFRDRGDITKADDPIQAILDQPAGAQQ